MSTLPRDRRDRRATSSLFVSNQGAVVQLRNPGVLSVMSSFRMDPELTFQERKVIVNRIGVDESCNIAVAPSMGDLIYTHPFSDNIGQLVISGIGFSRECGGVNGRETTGFAKIRDYFHKNKASKREDPITFTFSGNSVLRGYLGKWSGQLTETEQRIFSWTMFLLLIPDEEEADD